MKDRDINNYKEYFKLLFMTQEEVYSYVRQEAIQTGFQIESIEHDYIYCKSEKMVSTDKIPLLISHMDTVDTHGTSKASIVTSEDVYIAGATLCVEQDKNCVLGADDRSGVWIMLQLMRSNPDAYCFLFTCDEEIGGLGSSEFVKRTALPYHNHSCFVSLDRRGENDVALYGCDNNDLIGVFEKRGWKRVQGSFTDCMILSEACNIACINLAVGYDMEHTLMETQDLQVMLDVYHQLQETGLQSELSSQHFTYDVIPYGYPEDADCVCCDFCGVHAPLYKYTTGYNVDTQLCEDCVTNEETLDENLYEY